jgi:hypothetical protein
MILLIKERKERQTHHMIFSPYFLFSLPSQLSNPYPNIYYTCPEPWNDDRPSSAVVMVRQDRETRTATVEDGQA